MQIQSSFKTKPFHAQHGEKVGTCNRYQTEACEIAERKHQPKDEQKSEKGNVVLFTSSQSPGGFRILN